MKLNITGDVVDLTQQLIDVYSVSGAETELADMVQAQLNQLNHLEVYRDGDVLLARTNWGKKRRIILAGHLDTVPLPTVSGSLGTVPSTWKGDVLYGRGTTDMKGGVAVQLALAAVIKDSEFDLTFIFYDHEEVESSKNGLGRLSRKVPDLIQGDFAILLEPTDGNVEGGCNGTMRVKVSVDGLASHSARAWKGDNAIHKLAEPLTRLSQYEPQTVDVEGLAYREGMNAVHIEGGIAGNVIPDQGHILVNYRFAPDKTEAEAEAHLRQLFDGYEVEVTDSAAAARPGLDRPDIQGFLDAVGVEAKPKYGWTDVARFSELGIPAVNFGPGDPMLAHSDNEHVSAQQIRDCYEALHNWLAVS
ncbi:MAG: succinyl-diaminopimelate desuccinylase [Micrococcaceae bacterium]